MSEPPKEPIKYVDANLYLTYRYAAGDYRARYLRALKDKKIFGSRCSKTDEVLVPPIIASAESLAPADEFVEVSDRGIVTTFCIVNIPVIGRELELPYVAASVALDGADLSIFTLIQECKPEDARMGMRVAAVWKPDGERRGDHEDILYFRPTGEPDAPLRATGEALGDARVDSLRRAEARRAHGLGSAGTRLRRARDPSAPREASHLTLWAEDGLANRVRSS